MLMMPPPARRRAAVAIPAVSIPLLVPFLVGSLLASAQAGLAAGADRWESAIRAFEEEDRTSPPPRGGILFLGSSSIRMWDIDRDFPDLPTVHRGFGGSQIVDSIRHTARIVLPHAPRAIVLYAGDNDIAAGKTPERVAADFREFVAGVREALPRTRIVFVAIKPSIRRWGLVERMRRANHLIEEWCRGDGRLRYVDIDTPMIGADGTPRPELFAGDGLHLSRKGYELWTSLVRPHVEDLVTSPELRGASGEVTAWPRSLADWRRSFADPPREFSLLPFWFWNDALTAEEIVRQIDDFQAHGVHGFVIHPRIGLPRDIAFMSDRFLHFVKVAVGHAARRGMVVHLYDEGMYPSGSACGRVVAESPAHAARSIYPRVLAAGEAPTIGERETLVTVQTLDDGRRVAVIDGPSGGRIRGVHFGQDDGEKDQPPAADLLSPDAVACFIRHVHERYHEAVGEHFGTTVRAIFTDEPDLLGRRHRRGVRPWTTGLESHLERILGEDPRPRLPWLWYGEGPEVETFRSRVRRAVLQRMEETYYEPLSRWCRAHGVALTGHPARPDDLGLLRHFQIPGQDVVWRYLEPGKPKALEGSQSTMGKCSSSAAIHLGRPRNGNEALGAYGWNLTWREMRWVTNWLHVRGVDLIWPHAFYYSVAGPRRDERPPDVGPNNEWWPRYREYADATRRACWILAAGRHRADIAILGRRDRLPWRAAKALFEGQRDFNYLEAGALPACARVSADSISVGPMTYRAVVVDDGDGLDAVAAATLAPLASAGRVLALADASCDLAGAVRVPTTGDLIDRLAEIVPPDLRIDPPAAGLRYRRVAHPGREVWLLFNEGETAVRGRLLIAPGDGALWRGRLEDGELRLAERPIEVDLPAHATEVIVCERAGT